MSNNPYTAPQSDVDSGIKADEYCEIRLFSTGARLGRLRYFNRFFVLVEKTLYTRHITASDNE